MQATENITAPFGPKSPIHKGNMIFGLSYENSYENNLIDLQKLINTYFSEDQKRCLAKDLFEIHEKKLEIRFDRNKLTLDLIQVGENSYAFDKIACVQKIQLHSEKIKKAYTRSSDNGSELDEALYRKNVEKVQTRYTRQQ